MASPRKRLVCLAFAAIPTVMTPSGLTEAESGGNQQTTESVAPEDARRREELNAARQLAASGRIEAAASGYRRILTADPASFDAHFELALILMSQQKLDEARGQLVDAVNLRPENGPAYIRLAQVALQLDDMVIAEKALTAARRIDPQEASVRYNLGRVYEKLGKDEQALEEYLAFLKLAPRDPRANNMRARVALFYENAQQLDAAVALYGELIASDPSRASAHFALAGIYYRRARYDEALPEYEEVVRLDPTNAAAHSNIGFINRIKGRLEEAVAHFTRAVELDPTDISSLHFLGTVQSELGNLAESLAWLHKVIEIQPEHPLAHYAIGKILAKQGDREGAQREFELHRKIQAAERKKQTTATTMEVN